MRSFLSPIFPRILFLTISVGELQRLLYAYIVNWLSLILGDKKELYNVEALRKTRLLEHHRVEVSPFLKKNYGC